MSVRWIGCLFTLLLVLTRLGSATADISNLRLCADPECKEPISRGRTIIGYPSNDERILSFPVNAEVTVYSKEAGNRQDLWGAEIKGKRGYAPKQYIRELKIFVSKPQHEVPTGGATVFEDAPPSSSKSQEGQGESPKENIFESNVSEAATESLELTLSAEDVEYKRLKEASIEKYDDKSFTEEIEKDEEKERNDEERNEEQGENEIVDEENKDEERNEDDDENVEGAVEMEAEEEEAVMPEQGDQEVEPSTKEAEETEKKIEEHDEREQLNETLLQDESDQPSPESDIPLTDEAEDSKTEIDDISALSDYEVIDGTTLYFDDATPLPPTAEAVIPESLMPSSITEMDYATAHPPPLLPQAAFEETHGQNADIHVTTLNPEHSQSVTIDGAIESIVTESPSEATEVLPSEIEPEENAQEIDVEGITPTSSWISDETASVTSWFSNEEKETDNSNNEAAISEETVTPSHSFKSEDHSDEFSDHKEQSVIDSEEIFGNNVKEDEGFFSSWFSSSEAPETQENHRVSSEHSSATISDKSVDEQANVDSASVSEESSNGASEAEPVDTVVPSDTMQTLVEPTESPSILAQPPNTADDVDNAFNTQPSFLSSVDASPEGTATPDLELYPENPLEHGESLSTQDPGGRSLSDQEESQDKAVDDMDESDSAVESSEFIEQDDITLNSEVADVHTSSSDDEDDEDLGTSTARPLYAVPEPGMKDSHADSNVEQEELSRLAGKDAVMDGAEITDEPADGSLSEEFLKTSHNLWLAISGALQLPEGLAFGFEAELAEPQVSSGMLVFLLIVSGTVVTIYFVHLIMLKISREGPLVAALNRIDHENRVMTDAHESLHAELAQARAELDTVSSRITTSSGDVDELNSQLEIVKNEYISEKIQLEERIVQLEHELEETTTNGLEMHKMLSEMLSSQKDASAFQASVDHLQAMLDGQREKVETLTTDLALKNRLNEELHNELSASMERASKLDYQVEQLTHSLEELTGVKGEAIRKLQEEAAIVEELKVANATLSEQAGEYDSKVTTLSSELTELRDTINHLRESIETKESELQVAKECLKQFRLTSSDDNGAPDEEKLSALFDVIRVKAELQKINNERLTLVEQLQDAEMAQKNLEDTMALIRTEVSELRTHHDLAIRERQEAQSKLEVLTKYFEEKEAQLTKELESQEGLRVSAEGSAAVVAKKIQNYELELASYKTQVESLRKELEEQETSYKTQIASHEQKAHENWLQARAAERKHEEHRQENSQLRSRLTMLQKEKEEIQQSQVNIIKPTPKRVDANGTMSSPRPMVDGVDGDHSGPTSLHHDLDSPPIPPHPLHGPPPMLPMMFPPGGPLPPGVPPPHGLPPGVPPPPGLPHGVPPPHGLPPHPFLPGEPPFMGPLPPLPGDRRLPPAGGMSSPPFRRTGSPTYDHRNDRYSPVSDRSHISDRRYSPPPLRRRPLSPDMHRNRSPDRRSDRTRSPDRRSDRMRSPAHRNERRLDRRSPDRHYNRSPDNYMRHRTSPRNYYDDQDYNNDDPRLRTHHMKGKKTSTPLGPSDRC